MANVTILEAAKLTGKSTPTLYRDIKAGKLSKSPDGTVDTVELLRVYGLVRDYAGVDDDEAPEAVLNEQAEFHCKGEIDWLRSQIEKLKSDIKELKSEALEREKGALERERRAVERENRMMAILEYKAEGDGIFVRLSKWFNRKRSK